MLFANTIETLNCESLGQLKKATETLACQLMFPQHFSFSQTFTLGSIKQLDYELKIFYHMLVDEGSVRVNYHI